MVSCQQLKRRSFKLCCWNLRTLLWCNWQQPINLLWCGKLWWFNQWWSTFLGVISGCLVVVVNYTITTPTTTPPDQSQPSPSMLTPHFSHSRSFSPCSKFNLQNEILLENTLKKTNFSHVPCCCLLQPNPHFSFILTVGDAKLVKQWKEDNQFPHQHVTIPNDPTFNLLNPGFTTFPSLWWTKSDIHLYFTQQVWQWGPRGNSIPPTATAPTRTSNITLFTYPKGCLKKMATFEIFKLDVNRD